MAEITRAAQKIAHHIIADTNVSVLNTQGTNPNTRIFTRLTNNSWVFFNEMIITPTVHVFTGIQMSIFMLWL